MAIIKKTTVVLILTCALLIPIKAFAYTESLDLKSELSRIEEQVNFHVLIPENYTNWKMIFKNLDTENSKSILITFQDKGSEGKYVFESIQKKGNNINLRSGEHVIISKYHGTFTPWSPSRNNPVPSGGILKWVQNDTSVELKSSYMSKEEMIKLASKMK
ncbi:DUF4367 domain-containing protein [Priestia koreensis]|uniref:DUF4367 domain-containing protein n=1 Tax=Priestia koreensis TaxID=284581 RepID=UPI00345864C9